MSNKSYKKTKENSGFRIFLKIILVLLIILLIFFGTVTWYAYSKLNKINYVKLENIEINEGVAEKLKGYRNIAIFGVDARANTYSNTRSDCIIIASINQDNNKIQLTSIYRDTYVYIDGHGYDKITHAYAYGGPELAINTINKNLDLNISEFVAVNFDAVMDIIDSIGGVSIEVDSDEMGYINKYIGDINNEMKKNAAKLSTAGTHNLSGVQALAYSRIRYTAGGDFKRAERMREVLNATFSKAKTLSIGKLNSMADILLPKVYTNISSSEIIGLLPSIYQYSMDTGEGWPYDKKDYNTGIYYAAPVTLESNVKQLHEKLFGNNGYEVSDTVKQYSNEIIKKTGYNK